MSSPAASIAALWLTLTALSAGGEELSPSGATMLGSTVSLSDQMVDLTLNDTVFLGLRNNWNVRSAYIERIAQKYDLKVEEDRFNPKLVLSSRYLSIRNQDDNSRYTEVIPQANILGEYGTRLSLAWNNQLTIANRGGRTRRDGVTFTIIQPLLRGAGRDIATAPVALAKLREQANRLTLKATVSNTISQIIISYRELLRAQEQVRIAEAAYERSQQLLLVNRAMIEAGRMAEFEIIQTEANSAALELAVEEAANQLHAARLELLHLLALDLHTQIQATDALRARQVEVDLKQAQITAREYQPAYLSELIATEEAAIKLVVARNDRLWDVSLVGGATQVRDRSPLNGVPETNRSWENYVGLQIDVPIGDISRRQGEVRARVDLENQDIYLAEARQALERDVDDAVRNLGTRWRQYEIAKRARNLSLRTLEIEREKLQAGRSSNFQVLSFETDLRNAESALLNALIAYMNAQTDLDLVLGTTLESWNIELND